MQSSVQRKTRNMFGVFFTPKQESSILLWGLALGYPIAAVEYCINKYHSEATNPSSGSNSSASSNQKEEPITEQKSDEGISEENLPLDNKDGEIDDDEVTKLLEMQEAIRKILELDFQIGLPSGEKEKVETPANLPKEVKPLQHYETHWEYKKLLLQKQPPIPPSEQKYEIDNQNTENGEVSRYDEQSKISEVLLFSNAEDSILHPRQLHYFKAFKLLFKRRANINELTIDIPIKLDDGEFHLIEFEMKKAESEIISEIKIGDLYQGEPLNPRIDGEEINEEIRNSALNFLLKIYRDAGQNFPFTPRQMELMHCHYKNPTLTAREIGKLLNPPLRKISVRTYDSKILKRARIYLPENKLFNETHGKLPEAKVVGFYWWQQGFHFETA